MIGTTLKYRYDVFISERFEFSTTDLESLKKNISSLVDLSRLTEEQKSQLLNQLDSLRTKFPTRGLYSERLDEVYVPQHLSNKNIFITRNIIS